jgi:hypothetical protein
VTSASDNAPRFFSPSNISPKRSVSPSNICEKHSVQSLLNNSRRQTKMPPGNKTLQQNHLKKPPNAKNASERICAD